MLIKPHGGELVDRILSEEKSAQLMTEVPGMFSLTVSPDTISEIQNLARGVFSPLEGFLNRAELESVVSQGHLTNGLAWTIPILLAVDGGINHGNIADVVRMGADIVVTGSAVFDGKAPAENARLMLQSVRDARKDG